jgi:hypothetical protein
MAGSAVSQVRPFSRIERVSRIGSGSAAVPVSKPLPQHNDLPERGRVERSGSSIADQKLSQIDLAVRAHEATHLAALGALAGEGPSFDYLIGPDGTRYAVGGSVHVNLSPIPGDPEGTIRRAKAIIQAAYAVSMPSSADMRVAAEAYEMEMEAEREMAKKQGEASGGESPWQVLAYEGYA